MHSTKHLYKLSGKQETCLIEFPLTKEFVKPFVLLFAVCEGLRQRHSCMNVEIWRFYEHSHLFLNFCENWPNMNISFCSWPI